MGKKEKIMLVFCALTCTLLWTSLFLGFADSIDISEPPGTGDPSEADNNMRRIQAGFQQRLTVDHIFDLLGTTVDAADTGEHRKVTYHATIADPAQVATKAHLYMQADELRYQDDTNAAFDLTDTGTLNILSSDLVGTLDNDTYFSAVDFAGTGTVDLIKANVSDVAVIPDGSELATSGAPTENAGIANKKYVDDKTGTVGNVSPGDYQADGGGDGRESVVLANGMIMKMGTWAGTVANGATHDITFDSAFPTACVMAMAVENNSTNNAGAASGYGVTSSASKIVLFNKDDHGTKYNANWLAIGY